MQGQGYQQHVDMMDGIVKQKDKEVSRIRAAEKARVSGTKIMPWSGGQGG